MKYPKISIVTPSFNQAKYLEQTICSVLDQNYPNLEYVIIDGGSTDGSVEIIKKYADRVTYWVSEKDGGQYDAINKGFSKTSGEIMGWINSSDILYPWTLNAIAEIFESNDEIQWISGMPTNLGNGIYPQRVSCSKEMNMYDIISGDYKWIQQESTFWKRNLWNKIGGNLDTKIRYAGDFKLWLEFYNYTYLYNVSTILGGFRYHDIRRGGDISGIYVTEAEDLFKEFRSQASFKIKLKAFISKIFFRNSSFLRKIIKRLGIFTWYRHHTVVYDFYDNKWLIKIK